MPSQIEDTYKNNVTSQLDRYNKLVIGYHGCERKFGENILLRKDDIHKSSQTYNWLGSGVYFWEDDPRRAWEWATNRRSSDGNKIQDPFVIGAIINLGRCLDLSTRNGLEITKNAYELLTAAIPESNLPKNKPAGKSDPYRMLRFLDCVVIDSVSKLFHLDTVRSPFLEGNELYPSSGFCDKSHIQIAVHNIKVIEGYFIPR